MPTACANWPASSGCWACRSSSFTRAATGSPAPRFAQIAKLSRGAYLSFDAGSAARLKELLGAVAVYAAGGYRALADYGEKKGGDIPATDRAAARVSHAGCSSLFGGVAILGGLLLLVYLSSTPTRRSSRATSNGPRSARPAAAIPLVLLLLVASALRFLWLPLTWRSRCWRLALIAAAAFAGRRPAAPRRRDALSAHDASITIPATMSGTVLRGRFAGMRLAELDRAELVALLRECRAADSEGARLLEAYLDRLLRLARRDGRRRATPPRRARSADDMTVAEAYEILGLEPGADEAAISAAHHRLMMQLHPDHGGTDYLATKINRARDVLLKR